MISKKKIAVFVILIIIMLSFDAFALTPLSRYTKLAGFGVSTLGFGLFIFYFRSFPVQLRRFGILFILLMAGSILSANIIYKQSIMSGFIANSPMYLCGSVFLMYFTFVRYKIDLEFAKPYFLTLSWSIFFVFTALFLLGTSFESSSTDNVFGFGTLKKGVINLGAIIYLVYFFKRNKYLYLFLSVFLFSINHWADFQRYIFFVYIMIAASMLYTYRSKTVSTKAIAVILFIVPMAVTVLSTTNFGAKFAEKLGAVSALIEEDSSDEMDSSIDARISQTAIALESIKKYPLTGIGRIRASNKNMVTGSEYFHVSDIGILGIIYSYGILGIVILILQFGYLYNTYKRGRFVENPINNEFKLFAFFLLLHTILTGRSINSPAEFMIMVGLIEIGNYQYKQLKLSNA
jgi:O-Antigen ligase